LVSLALVLLLVTGFVGLKNLRFNDDVAELFSPSEEGQSNLRDFEDSFDAATTTLAVVLSLDHQLSAADVSTVAALSDALSGIDGVAEVLSLTNADVAWDQDGEVRIGTVFGPAPRPPGDVSEAALLVRRLHPQGPRLVSSDLESLGVFALPDDAHRGNEALTALAEEVRTVALQALSTHTSDAEASFGGLAYHRMGNMEVMERDLLLLTPLAGLIVFFVVWLAFRDLRATAALLLPLGVSNALLLGFIGATGHSINPLTAVLPALMGVMGVADGMHVVSKYRLSTAGSPRERAAEALAATGVACLLTSVTTMIAFGSLWFTSLPILREFGLFAALGMAISLACVVLLVPSGLILLQVTANDRADAHKPGASTGWATWITSRHRPRWVALASVALLVGSVSFSTSARLDQFLADTLDERHPASIANRILDDHLGGTMPLEISLSGPPGVFRTPVGLRRIADVEAWARDREGAQISLSLSGVLQRLYAALSAKPGQDVLGNASAIEQLLLVADTEVVRSVVDDGFAGARIIVMTRDSGAAHFSALRQELQTYVEGWPPQDQMHAEVNGETVYAAEGLETLGRELGWGLVGSCLIITFVLALALRSLRLALISIVPNVLPVMLICAVWHLDPVAAISFTVVLGIAVDDTVHMLTRHRVESQFHDAPEAAARAVNWSFGPVLWTTVSLALGFSVLVVSGFPPNRTFGVLVASGLVLALVSDLVVTPALLATFAQNLRGI
jgi:hypothetical protein